MKKRLTLALIAALLLLSCRAAPGVGRSSPSLDDEYAVYSAVIQSTYLGEYIQSIVIQSTTRVDKDMAGSEELKYVQRELKEVTQSLMNDFTTQNRQLLALEQRFDLPVEVVLLTQEKIDAVFNDGSWDEFYRQYPNSQGILVLSRVGFNSTVDQALVYAGCQSHYLAGAGYYYLMVKEDGAWKIKNQLMVWIS
jgi:hypothetical protein